VWITAVLLVLAAFFGALGAADANRRAVWAFTAAALAALGTAVATFESAFDFERLSRQFSETGDAVALRNAKGPKPDEGVPGFVTAIEEILGSEVDRWSHQALATLGATAEESTPGSDTGPSTDPPVTSVPPGPG
jgi:hypothetical protein